MSDRQQLPEHVQLARASGDAVPQGVHTCESGKAKGAPWVYTDEYWSCPFCGDHGKDWKP